MKTETWEDYYEAGCASALHWITHRHTQSGLIRLTLSRNMIEQNSVWFKECVDLGRQKQTPKRSIHFRLGYHAVSTGDK